MNVYEAVKSRRAVREFKDQPVSREVLERVLSAAAWSPSGSNIQPWNIYVLTGAPLVELKTRAVERVAHGEAWDERQYEMYAAATRRRTAQLPADGMVAGSPDSRGGSVTPGSPHPLLRHVNWVRRSYGDLPAYGPRPA